MEGSGAKVTKSSPNILSNYRVWKNLGSGAFGKVKLAVHVQTGIKVAIKFLDCQSIGASDAEKVRREINILRLFSHPHIVRLYEVLETPSIIYVVMEYMDCGELYDYITERGRLLEDEARHLFQQIIAGVEYCHHHMVVHRDLKPENILLDTKHNIKIADFGLSNIMRDGHFLKTICGSPNYAAPEVISERFYAGPEVDVWSCGIILYALLCGTLPFDADNLPGLYSKIKNGVYTMPKHLSQGARDLIARILVVDPINRISIPEIRKHPWFQQYLPHHIATTSANLLYGTKKINWDIIMELARMGFDIHEVTGALQNGLQNNATVIYHLLSDNHFECQHNYFKNSLPEVTVSQVVLDQPEIYRRPPASVEKNWAIGFQSQASPIETMTRVLKVLHKLNVRWKEIGRYNMKCLWISRISTYATQTINDGPAKINNVYGLESSIVSMSRLGIRMQDTVKFEIQLYKASEELYLLDIQRISGSPFLFLELCAAFFMLAAA
ncbi:Non-specific serine/threonine protein kinase [Bertholletia excelsa]